MKPFRRSSRSAFTLVEVLFASAIVAAGMTATLTMLTATQINNSSEQERARARMIVYEELERLRNQLYSQIAPDSVDVIWDNGTPDDIADDTTALLVTRITDPGGNALTAAPIPAVYIAVEVTLYWSPKGRISNKRFQETVMAYFAP